MTIDQTKQAILKEFNKEFYEDVQYMTKASHGITPVGVRCKMPPYEAEKWLSKSLDRLERSVQEEYKGKTKRIWYQQGWNDAIDSLKKNHE